MAKAFTIKDAVVYLRATGLKARNTDGKGGGETISDQNVIANDTFPEKRERGNPYPLQ